MYHNTYNILPRPSSIHLSISTYSFCLQNITECLLWGWLYFRIWGYNSNHKSRNPSPHVIYILVEKTDNKQDKSTQYKICSILVSAKGKLRHGRGTVLLGRRSEIWGRVAREGLACEMTWAVWRSEPCRYLRESISGEATARAKVWGKDILEEPSRNRKGPIWLWSGLKWVTGCVEVES